MNPSGNPPHLRRAGTKIEKRGEDKGIGSLIFTSIVLHSDG